MQSTNNNYRMDNTQREKYDRGNIVGLLTARENHEKPKKCKISREKFS